MNSPYIYVIENLINGHKYVGKSSGRKKEYFGSGVALQQAIKKYGKSNFEKTILEFCTLDELNDKEKEWIQKLNTYIGPGYNLTPGGDGWTEGMKHSKTTLEKLKQNSSQKGKKRSPETIEKIKNSLKNYRDSLTEEERKQIYGKSGEKLKGRKKQFTEEHRKNLSLGQKGKPKSPRTSEHIQKIAEKKKKKVQMLTILESKVIETFESLKQAEEKTKIPSASISCACTGKQKTAGGYKWRFYE